VAGGAQQLPSVGVADLRVDPVPGRGSEDQVEPRVVIRGPRLERAAVAGESSQHRKKQQLKRLKIVDAFPMTVTGKVRKIDMRAQSSRELGLQAQHTA